MFWGRPQKRACRLHSELCKRHARKPCPLKQQCSGEYATKTRSTEPAEKQLPDSITKGTHGPVIEAETYHAEEQYSNDLLRVKGVQKHHPSGLARPLNGPGQAASSPPTPKSWEEVPTKLSCRPYADLSEAISMLKRYFTSDLIMRSYASLIF